MAVNYTDFDKVWASASPLTPYEFSDSQYAEGWNFVGATPPSRQMWDAFMKHADEKMQYLVNNYLPLSGGTLTGVVNGVTPTSGDDTTKLATTAYVQEEIRQHGNLPVGHEYFSMNPNIPQGSLPLIGGVYSRETYADLWAWVQKQTGYLKTEVEWQALSDSSNGNVPFYSDGDGSTTFRVPSLKCWIKGSDGTETVGTYKQAGLPNITSKSQSYSGVCCWSGSTKPEQVGVIERTATSWAPASGSIGAFQYIDFDASRSSSIYGRSSTVVPESIVGMWLVKAYGTIVDTGQIDEQAYIDDRYNAMKTYVDGKFLPAVGNAVVGDLSAIESQELDTSISGVDILLYKLGRLVTFKIDGVGTLPAPQTAYNIATIPALYRPITDVFFDCVLTASDAVLGHARISINATTGVVTVESNRADISEWRGVCSYISAN